MEKKMKIMVIAIVVAILIILFLINVLLTTSGRVMENIEINREQDYVTNLAAKIDIFDSELGEFEIAVDLPYWGYYEQDDEESHKLQITSDAGILFDEDGGFGFAAAFGVHPKLLSSTNEINCLLDYQVGQLIVKKQNEYLDNGTLRSVITLNACGDEMVFEDIYTKEEVYTRMSQMYDASVKMDFTQ